MAAAPSMTHTMLGMPTTDLFMKNAWKPGWVASK